jgi:trehalose/maltose hydrolase-like predicted phosphorylase
VLAALDPQSSWQRFLVALESDIGDVQGGTTKEGIHMGVMAGTLDLVQRGYAGMYIRDGMLRFDPRLTRQLAGLSFAMQFHAMPLRIAFGDGRLTVAAHREGGSAPIRVAVQDEVRELHAGDEYTFQLRSDGSPGPQTEQ